MHQKKKKKTPQAKHPIWLKHNSLCHFSGRVLKLPKGKKSEFSDCTQKWALLSPIKPHKESHTSKVYSEELGKEEFWREATKIEKPVLRKTHSPSPTCCVSVLLELRESTVEKASWSYHRLNILVHANQRGQHSTPQTKTIHQQNILIRLSQPLSSRKRLGLPRPYVTNW